MGNQLPRLNNSGNQQQGVISQPAQSRGFFSGVGRSTNTGPKSSYATPVKEHIVLGQPASYTVKNLSSIFGKNVSGKYPTGEGQIYNIK